MSDPLDDFVRRAVDAVPVPPRLEARVRSTVARRRVVRILAVAAAALLVVLLWPRPTASEPVVRGPRLALSEPARPMEMRDVQFDATVRTTEDGISIRFEGARDE